MPLVVQTHYPGFAEPDLMMLMKRFEALFLGGQRYVLLVHNMPGAPVLSVSQRRLMAHWWKANSDAIRRANIATAVVLESTLFRGTMTALNWLVEPVSPMRACSTFSEGLDYCLERLAAEGIALPDVERVRAAYAR